MAAHDRTSGAFVGWFALFDDGVVGGLRTAELGCRLRREVWGGGHGPEGARAPTAVAFDRLGFDRVRAGTMAVTPAFRRAMAKAGFRHVETVFRAFANPLSGAEQGEVIDEVRRAGL